MRKSDPVAGTRRSRLAFVALLMVTFVGGAWFGHVAGIGAPTHSAGFALIADSWELLHNEYVDAARLDPSAVAHGAIRGMADAVGDTDHTYFLSPAEAVLEAEAMSGSYGGVGFAFGRSADTALTVASLVPDAPAKAAGLRVGDRVIAVDGVSTEGADADEVTDRIPGDLGTMVVLTVERPGRTDPLELRMTRALIDWSAASWAMVPGTRLALVQLIDFSEGAADELITAVSAAIDAGATGLVLDLRGNPGGYVAEEIGVAGVFLEPGCVVLRQRAADGTETVEVVPQGSVPTDLPMVVLVDGDTVSAPEVVAAALQEARRATIVGTRTFGTGTTNVGHPLADGSSLVIGVTRWLTPSGRSIWHVGMTPDIEVPLPNGAIPLTPDELAGLSAAMVAKSTDTQLLRAIDLLRSGTGQLPLAAPVNPGIGGMNPGRCTSR